MKSEKSIYLYMFLLSVIFSCDDSTINTYTCGAPSLITADQSCNTGQGLVLTATIENATWDLEWTIIAVKDSAAKGWKGSDPTFQANTKSKSYAVPDSIIKNYKTLIVRVASECPDGNKLYSIYHRFIQTHPINSSCIVWTFNNQE
jgi:hypothetical protein